MWLTCDWHYSTVQLWLPYTIPTTTKRWRATHPEPIVGARVSKVDDQFKRFMVERLESQKNVVDQQVTIHIQHPSSPVHTQAQNI